MFTDVAATRVCGIGGGEARMGQKTSRPEIPDERKALALLQQALAILDAIDAPGDIGAHVDFAIQRLHDEMAKRTT